MKFNGVGRIGLTALFSLLLFMIFLSHCGKSPFDISPRDAMSMIESGREPVIIDVRTIEEFTGELGHIPKSRHIPIDLFADSVDVLKEYQDGKLILVCHSGNRSGRAMSILRENGFDGALNLAGGIVAWRDAGGITETGLAQ